MKMLMILGFLMFAGCTSQTPLGRCVGLGQDKDATLRYAYSTRNIVLGTVFIQTLFVPVLVVLNQLECPVAVK